MKDTLAFQMLVLYRDFFKYSKEELKEVGLNFGQIPLLLYIGKHPGCTQAKLTEALRLDWGHSQRSVKKLADDGFLTKVLDPKLSCNVLELTKRGLEANEEVRQMFFRWDQIKRDELSKEEEEVLLSILGKMAKRREESGRENSV